MSYLSSKKIYPGNWNEPLNGWYKNIDTNDSGTNDSSKGGPTSVLATPGFRYFQVRGYVPVTATSGGTLVATGDVIIPSPYRNDDTRTDITGLVISGSSTQPAYAYRTALSVASGWGDGRVASGVYAATGVLISFGRDTTSGDAAGKIFFSGGSQAFGSFPFLTATGAAGVSGGVVNYEVTDATTFKVFTKDSGNATATSGGLYISDADSAASKTGYLVVEICYIQPDDAPGYEDIDGYLTGRTVS
jgi:hypothetical protein